MKKIIAFSLLAVMTMSCEKEDVLLSGSFISDQVGKVDMVSEGGVDYQMQVYYDLSGTRIISQNKRDVWDLAFSCDWTKPNVFTNGAMLQRVAYTGSTDFSANYNPQDFDFNYERAWRYLTRGLITDSWTAMQPNEGVYILDLGKNLKNEKRGFKLFQIIDLNVDGYTIKLSNLDHSQAQELTIPLDDRYNNVFISLDKPEELVKVEPQKTDWDFYFTKYMERLYDGADTLDYSVVGCLINPFGTAAYMDPRSAADSTVRYSDLEIEDYDANKLVKKQDVIGHEWKYFDLDDGAYAISENMNFFIKDKDDYVYRFHFTGYYDDQGLKGGISFEFLPL